MNENDGKFFEYSVELRLSAQWTLVSMFSLGLFAALATVLLCHPYLAWGIASLLLAIMSMVMLAYNGLMFMLEYKNCKIFQMLREKEAAGK